MFSGASKGVLLLFKGVKGNRSLQGGSFHTARLGSLVLFFFSFVSCVLDELHLNGSLENVLLELIKVFL